MLTFQELSQCLEQVSYLLPELREEHDWLTNTICSRLAKGNLIVFCLACVLNWVSVTELSWLGLAFFFPFQINGADPFYTVLWQFCILPWKCKTQPSATSQMEGIRGKLSKGKGSCQQEWSEIAGLKSHSRQGTLSYEEETKMLTLTRGFPILFYRLLGHQNGKSVFVTWEWENRTMDV